MFVYKLSEPVRVVGDLVIITNPETGEDDDYALEDEGVSMLPGGLVNNIRLGIDDRSLPSTPDLIPFVAGAIRSATAVYQAASAQDDIELLVRFADFRAGTDQE